MSKIIINGREKIQHTFMREYVFFIKSRYFVAFNLTDERQIPRIVKVLWQIRISPPLKSSSDFSRLIFIDFIQYFFANLINNL